jgi:tetratricopeptide (TPR) repeat protein
MLSWVNPLRGGSGWKDRVRSTTALIGAERDRAANRPGRWLAALLLGLVAIRPGLAAADRAEARAHTSEGRALLDAGRFDDALAQFRQALTADPDYLPACEEAVRLWLALGAYEVAIAALERATLRHPDYAFGWYALGYAYRMTGRPALALAAYDSNILLRPAAPEPWYGIGLVHRELGQRRQAAEAFRRYLALEQRASQALYVERARRALATLEQTSAAEQQQGAAPAGPLAAAARLVAARRYGSAARLLARLGDGSVDPARWWTLWGQIALGQGDHDAAMAAGLLALAASPWDRDAEQLLALSHGQRGDTAVARYFVELVAPGD